MNTWQLTENQLGQADGRKWESLFAQGNGYFGWRGAFEEDDTGDRLEGNYVNGFYETYPIRYPEIAYGYPEEGQTMVNVMNAKILRLRIDGEPVRMVPERVGEYERTLDFRTGVLTRRYVFTAPGGAVARVVLRRLISQQRAHCGILDLQLTLQGRGAKVEIESALDIHTHNQSADKDPRVGTHLPQDCFDTLDSGCGEDILYAEQRTKRSRLGIACSAVHRLEGAAVAMTQGPGELTLAYTATLAAGDTLRLQKAIAYVAQNRPGEGSLLHTAQAEAQGAIKAGFDILEAENAAFFAAHWARADVVIEGDEVLQQGLRFNNFHLLQSVGRDGLRNIAAKGLTGEGYEGHYFWDTEMFVIPALLYCRPEICRELLRYRYGRLDAARARAREMGHKRGALFPWRTIGGSECSTFFPAGSAQYHIIGDIAMAVKNYVQVTGDRAFLREAGAELLLETARIWADIGHFSPLREGQFCIDCVTGPDEYTAVVNNNYYTNRIAREHLWYACKVARELAQEAPEDWAALRAKLGLGEEEPVLWQRAADAMFFPYDDQAGVALQDDSFAHKAEWDFAGTPKDQYPLLLHFHPLVISRHKVLKQADTVLADLLFDQYLDREQIRRNFDYYEPLTTHDSSLSSCVYSMVACKIGYLDKAYSYFLRCARTDLDDHKGNTKDGVHIANMAGTSACVLQGFGGLRQWDGALRLHPLLPAQWMLYRFAVCFMGCLLRVEITREQVTLTLEEGQTLTFQCYDEAVTLGAGETRSLPLQGGCA